jgi:hypothetical protein
LLDCLFDSEFLLQAVQPTHYRPLHLCQVVLDIFRLLLNRPSRVHDEFEVIDWVDQFIKFLIDYLTVYSSYVSVRVCRRCSGPIIREPQESPFYVGI